uniref:Uncharacterized protein n=1 Tax=Rhizophora mucronata TaxID=61149 RepID=A0A2P2NZE4_RHIMU
MLAQQHLSLLIILPHKVRVILTYSHSYMKSAIRISS